MEPKIHEFGSPNRPKNNQKSIKNHKKNRSKIDLGGSWGRLGALLRSRWPQERKRTPKIKVLTPYWGPSWGPKSIKMAPKSDPKSDHFFDRFEDRFLERFGANLAPSWHPKPSQNRAKLGSKMHPKSKQPKSQKL